jgi:hypothetical protein
LNLTDNTVPGSIALLEPSAKDYIFWGVPTILPEEVTSQKVGAEELKRSPSKNGLQPVLKKSGRVIDQTK